MEAYFNPTKRNMKKKIDVTKFDIEAYFSSNKKKYEEKNCGQHPPPPHWHNPA